MFVKGGNSVHDAIMRREENAHDVGAVAEVLRARIVVPALLSKSGNNVDAVEVIHGLACLLQRSDAVADVCVAPHGVVPQRNLRLHY